MVRRVAVERKFFFFFFFFLKKKESKKKGEQGWATAAWTAAASLLRPVAACLAPPEPDPAAEAAQPRARPHRSRPTARTWPDREPAQASWCFFFFFILFDFLIFFKF